LFKRHLKLFEEAENIGFADLGNQNLRTSPVAPQQPWKANITFSNGNEFLAPNREFFKAKRSHQGHEGHRGIMKVDSANRFAKRSIVAKIRFPKPSRFL